MDDAGGAVPEVCPDEACSLVDGGAALLDVREPQEWAAGHAPGALHVPLGELGDRLGEVPDGLVVVVCRSGARSAVAAGALRDSGRDARNLAGGMKAWAASGLGVVTDGGADGTVV